MQASQSTASTPEKQPKLLDQVRHRLRVKTAGGKWHRQKQLWQLPYKDVLQMGITERIVDER